MRNRHGKPVTNVADRGADAEDSSANSFGLSSGRLPPRTATPAAGVEGQVAVSEDR